MNCCGNFMTSNLPPRPTMNKDLLARLSGIKSLAAGRKDPVGSGVAMQQPPSLSNTSSAPPHETIADKPRREVPMNASQSNAPPALTSPQQDVVLAEMLQRIQKLTHETSAGSATSEPASNSTPPHPASPYATETRPATTKNGVREKKFEKNNSGEFVPTEPESFQDAGVTPVEVESLIMKFLLNRGESTGRGIADQVKIPFAVVEKILRQLKQDQLVAYKDAAEINDYVYVLSGSGRERARRYEQECTYFGSAPVSLSDYWSAVKLQSLQDQNPGLEDLERAFADLLINPKMLKRLGPAINSGRGMFLFGYPGNGKTSIAERVTRCFGEHIWIPRALGVDGEIIRVFDPNHHEEVPLPPDRGILNQSRIDRRWIRIRRPTIIAGGELTMDNLEITVNRQSGTTEAPLQLKSNCGTLVIDDFGRQRMGTDELLNRWIVPLEKRYDFLNLPSGKKIEVPFDQLVIFSTNLEPKDLVDDAFLRRIPYKIEVCDPTEDEFRSLFRIMCPKMGCEHNEDVVSYLIETHYKSINRPFRCCQPRDLLLQVK
ncbi:MAG: AAA family ATPase, partial [Planctomycetota bacterium]|nr:AAA family ATPase [Planctomycetota bacterium]